MVDVQTANESASIKRSAMLGKEPEEALHQRVKLPFGYMGLRLVQHRLSQGVIYFVRNRRLVFLA